MALKSVGALWKKEGKKGVYMTGTIDAGILGQLSIAVFPITDKENEKSPDAQICLFHGDPKE
ncbi:MAG: hypothetical protein HQ543_03470 [Bacteroidetes bacterium]|nr:hypothetical protein [Bacteroidota bacterium]